MKYQRILVVSLVLLGLVALLVGLGITTNGPLQAKAMGPPDEETHLAAGSEAVPDSTFYAANPELKVAQGYTAMAPSYAAKEGNGLQRGLEADAARYTAMATYYAAKEGNGLQRGLEADAARYNAMAEYYAAKEAAGLQRGLEADAARYSAMAEYYATMVKNERVIDPALYAANPELMAARR